MARAARGSPGLVGNHDHRRWTLVHWQGDRRVIALDIDTGKQLWQFQTGSGINAQPITYTHNGKQHVTILSGIGGLWWNIAREQLKDKVPQGGSVWTFALID